MRMWWSRKASGKKSSLSGGLAGASAFCGLSGGQREYHVPRWDRLEIVWAFRHCCQFSVGRVSSVCVYWGRGGAEGAGALVVEGHTCLL